MPRANDTSPSIDEQIKELSDSGWRRQSASVWVDPDGALFRGPHGAWKALRARNWMYKFGITDQDIYETMPPKPEDAR